MFIDEFFFSILVLYLSSPNLKEHKLVIRNNYFINALLEVVMAAETRAIIAG